MFRFSRLALFLDTFSPLSMILPRILITVCFVELSLIGGIRVQKASRQTLDHIKTLITRSAQRQFDGRDFGVLSDAQSHERKDPDAAAHHDELSVNDPNNYFQGDVDLSDKQAELISQNLETQIVPERNENLKIRKKRKVGRQPFYISWDRTRPISYEFSDSIPPETREKIRAAIGLWERMTCLRFLENGPDVDRIEFFDGGGCSSFVGRTGGTQGISISTPGCDIIGIISHEIGHALGIFHEQARPDQNNHIFINYNNIPLSRWNNFHSLSQNEADTYNLPYDTGSVMHYGAYGFASDPYVPTITTRDKFRQYTIGQREGPSFLDYEAINILYHCTDHCSYLPCEHNGYPNPSNCARCLCPSGFAGPLCQFVDYTTCGALIRVSTSPMTISSPNYPNYYSTGDQCVWLLKAPASGMIFLQFVEQMQLHCEDTCDKSYVELKTSADFRVTGYRFCCSKVPKEVFQSKTNEMLVIFRAYGNIGKGFKAKIWSNLPGEIEPIPAPAPLPALVTKSNIFLSKTTKAITDAPQPYKAIKSTESVFRSSLHPTSPLTTKSTTSPLATTKPTASPLTSINRTEVIITMKPFRSSTTTKPLLTGVTTPEENVKHTTAVPGIALQFKMLCKCGEWSEWNGACSQNCGGCGKRSRHRQCSSTECRTEDKRSCKFNVCPPGTNFLINNGEFHILWKGCCVGLFRSGLECSALDDGQNPFLKIIETLLSAEDQKKNKSSSNGTQTIQPRENLRK